jgi:hypothetical protein
MLSRGPLVVLLLAGAIDSATLQVVSLVAPPAPLASPTPLRHRPHLRPDRSSAQSSQVYKPMPTHAHSGPDRELGVFSQSSTSSISPSSSPSQSSTATVSATLTPEPPPFVGGRDNDLWVWLRPEQLIVDGQYDTSTLYHW